MNNPVTDEERSRIIVMLRDEKMSQNATAKAVGRGASTVSRIAKEEGIEAYAKPKKAEKARLAYGEDRRLELIGKGFEKADTLLEVLQDAGEFQKWTVALGTLVDKARLESGEATSRDERHNHNHPNDLDVYFKELDAAREGNATADTE